MPFAYRAADLFIGALARRGRASGCPRSEALACGVPALLSDVPGRGEIGADAAWYFADGDPESLARALPPLLSGGRPRPGPRGRARRGERYDSAERGAEARGGFRRALRHSRAMQPSSVTP
jgi:glycosyltransferase involved in cell wall biosynthesis